MAVAVRVANAGAAQGTLSRKVAIEIRRRMDKVGKQMVKDAEMGMEARWDLNRPFERRRWPGSRRAKGSIGYTIEGGPDMPVTLGFRVLGGEETRQKIIGLNWGVPGHAIIGGTDTWPLKGHLGTSRTARGFEAERGVKGQLLAWEEGGGWVFAKRVEHPGNAGGDFLGPALEKAAAKLKSP